MHNNYIHSIVIIIIIIDSWQRGIYCRHIEWLNRSLQSIVLLVCVECIGGSTNSPVHEVSTLSFYEQVQNTRGSLDLKKRKILFLNLPFVVIHYRVCSSEVSAVARPASVFLFGLVLEWVTPLRSHA